MCVLGQKENRALASKRRPLPFTWHDPQARLRAGAVEGLPLTEHLPHAVHTSSTVCAGRESADSSLWPCEGGTVFLPIL